jgi:hypothetical protein
MSTPHPECHEFIAAHVEKSKVTKAVWDLVNVLGSADADDCSWRIHRCVSDILYKHYLTTADKSDWETLPIRTSADLYAIRTPSERTAANRKVAVTKIHAALKTGQPLLPPTWLNDVNSVVLATQQVYSRSSTFQLAWLALTQFCEAMGPEYWPLKKQYYKRFSALPVPDAPEKLPVLSAEELQTIRTKNGTVIERAMEYCAQNDTSAAAQTCILDALCIEQLYGCSNKHQPLRRDWPSVVFKTPGLDTSQHNYFDTDAGILTITHAQKRGKLPDPLHIPLTDTSPRLCKLLTAWQPLAMQLQQGLPHVMFGSKGPLSPGQLSSRMAGVWKRLGFDPGSGRRGANGARHACVAINRKRRKLTPDERAVEADEARRRISSVKMAEEVYG